MMQRIHRRAENPSDGLDGAGAVFADAERTAAFARSHGVPFGNVPVGDQTTSTAARQVVVHAFKGEVGLIEVREGDRVRHFDAAQADPGDIRPRVTYAPDIAAPAAFDDLCAWSATLSRHIPRPYVQVWWLGDGSTVGLDRIEVDPYRIPVLSPEWDARLGALFDVAHARMLLQPYRAGALDNRVPGGTFSPEDAV